MNGFFNSKNPWRARVQVLNMIAFTWAAIDLITNPQAKLGDGCLDLAVHGLTYLSFKEHDNILIDLGAATLNTFRLGSLFSSITSGCSNVSTVLSTAEVLGHLVNTGTAISLPTESKIEEKKSEMNSLSLTK